MEITPTDDCFHPPAVDDPMWTETTWWGFYASEPPLGGMIYAMFRPNLGVASVVVQVWDAEAVEPWRLPYARSQWHIPHPTDELTRCGVGGLAIECVAPLAQYRLAYRDGDTIEIDLLYTALEAPNGIGGEGSGHFDQLCRAQGEVRCGAVVVPIDASVMRDRSWYVRNDNSSLRAGYTYGVVDDGTSFLVQGFRMPDSAPDESTIFGGSYTVDGRTAKVVSGTRRVLERHRGHPLVVHVEAADEAGRTFAAQGRVACSAASQSTPGMFAWMSVVEWSVDRRQGHGEDHDVWSPDHLARSPRLG